MIVKQLFDIANLTIGGQSTGYSITELNTAVEKVNLNFEKGANEGFLTCPGPLLGSLGDFVWNDQDYDGIQDQGETGIPGVTVELYKCTGDAFVKKTTTDQSGYYIFNDLIQEDYYVKVIVPDGYTVSPQNSGSNDQIDSDIDQSTWRTTCIQLASGEHNTTVDAGLYSTSQCSELAILKTASKTNPKCGETFSYTIKVTNNGPANTQNVAASDILAPPLEYVSSTPLQGTYEIVTGKWNVGDLTKGASVILVINVRVVCSPADNSSVDLGAANGFNLFVLGSLNQPSADTQGKVAVGGDAYLSGYSVGDALPGFSGDVLIVGHNLTYISGRVYNGNVVYGTSTNLPANGVSISDGTLRKDTLIDFTAASAFRQNLSSSLSGFAANGTVKFEWGELKMTGTDPFLNVINVSGSDLSNANSVVINAPNGSVVLLNICGQNVSMHGGLVLNGASAGNVLYNFYQAQNLKIQGINVMGTILAPWADLSFPAGLVTGEVIVKSMTGSGQFNNCLFNGKIPVPQVITNTASITGGSSCDNDPNNNSYTVVLNVNITSGNGGGGDNGLSGVYKLSTVVSEFSLKQNYPNPFNPSTTIEFSIPADGQYTLKLYNILGQEILTLLNGQISSGVHTVSLDAGKLTSGTYIYQLSGDKVTLIRKLILIK